MSGAVDFLTGRAPNPGYTADTAPAGMRWVYEALAPASGTHYGDVLPIKREADGRLGFAMPNALREGLLGMADLLSGTETGELTGRGAQSITMGGLGAGMTMAPRGALAAGGARGTVNPYLAMDEAARLQRAREMGFHPELKLYHGTGRTFDAFAHSPPARSSGLPPTVGVAWSAEEPALAGRFAELASQANQGTGSQILPLMARWDKLAGLRLTGNEKHAEVMDAIRGAFHDGYNAVRLKNYTTFPEFGPQTIWAFRDPNQLRSRFARFDPAQRDSTDLLAGFAAPAPVGFNVREPAPPGLRFDPALVPNELRRLQDRVY